MSPYFSMPVQIQLEIEKAVRSAYGVMHRNLDEFSKELFGGWYADVRRAVETGSLGVANDWLLLLERCDALCRVNGSATPTPPAVDQFIPDPPAWGKNGPESHDPEEELAVYLADADGDSGDAQPE